MIYRFTTSSLLILSLCIKAYAQEGEAIAPPAAADKVFTSLEQAKLSPDSVYRLDLSRKKLKVIPPVVYTFKNLYELDISRNRLDSLPYEIGQLKSLKVLNASNNRLISIPPEIGRLKALEQLRLNRNLLATLPSETGQLQNLQILELWDNEIDSLPDEIKHLKQLQVLELRGILFSDEGQNRIRKLLPETRIYFSPSCLCKD